MIWTRQRQANQLRSTLREFYPAALVFDDLTSGDALSLLSVAPTPKPDPGCAPVRPAGRPRPGHRRDGASVAALVEVIGTLNVQIAGLEAGLADRFELAEFGDDPNRYADAKSRKNYAGTSPITKASGTRRVVLARYAPNRRLADACYLWAFAPSAPAPAPAPSTTNDAPPATPTTEP